MFVQDCPADLPLKDSLTGLSSHGFFQLSLEREMNRFRRYKTPFALCIVDIDAFSQYNLKQGHIESDRALITVGRLIQENVREVDLVSRYGGDQFAIILVENDPDSALIAAERLRKSIEKFSDGQLTVSIGIAGLDLDDAASKEELICRAKTALTQAKLRGKNKALCYREDVIPLDAGQPTILAVDDEPLNRKLLKAIIKRLGYNVLTAESGKDALCMLSQNNIDLVILDIMMPEMDGIEVCNRIKSKEETRMIPVILVTGLDDTEVKINGIEAGADDFITKPPNAAELMARIKSLVRLKKLNNNLTSIENVLFSLANAVEAKDQYTLGHVERVSEMALSIGKQMNLCRSDLEALKLGGVLHDIGKIGIPREIINKPGPLNHDEWKLMEKHPIIGYKICMPLKKNLGAALDVIRHHHEKMDGSGYPDGLKGDSISMVARIMAVADIYDALITDRPYRKAFSISEAREILRRECREGKLDPNVVDRLTGVSSLPKKSAALSTPYPRQDLIVWQAM